MAAFFAAAPVANAATALYPDLRLLPPRDLKFDRVDVTGSDSGATGERNVLRFTNTVLNRGEGDLVVRGDLTGTLPNRSGTAYQRIYDDAGGFTERQAGSFYWHQAHMHFHYEGWGRYELWKAADYRAWEQEGKPERPVQTTGSKTTSCILDEEFIGGAANTRWPARYRFSGCEDNNGQLLEGLAVGWGDTYDSWRHDQWIDLNQATLADGEWAIRSVIDPGNEIQESPSGTDPAREDPRQNDSVQFFRVQGGQIVDEDAPTGTVTLNDVSPSTTNSSVTLKVLGRDDVSGTSSFRVSNDGQTWSAPITYTGRDSTPHALTWNLTDPAFGGTPDAGTKTVYVQFTDASGKRGPSETDSITLVGPGPSTHYSRTVRDDGPVSHWRLDEANETFGAIDEVGGNNGAFTGAPTLGAPGLLGAEPTHTAVRFDGVDDSVFASDNAALDLTTGMSLEAWIKPTAFPAEWASVLSKPEAYSLQFRRNQLEFTVIVDPTGHPDRGRERLRLPAGAVPLDRTSHIVGTYNGLKQRLYVDGVLAAERDLTKPAQVNARPLTIGSWEGDERFTGTIDEPAVYPAALPLARVTAHYDAGRPAPEAPAAPTLLTAAPDSTSATEIDLAWQDNSSDESSFTIERSTVANDFTNAVTLSASQDREVFTDTGLDPNRRYWYRVLARNPVGASGWSNVANATTRAAPPVLTTSAPTGVGETTATLQGTVNPRGADTSYGFEYRKAGDTQWTSDAWLNAGAGRSPVAVTKPLSKLQPSTTYETRLVGSNAGGSVQTATASFTTSALGAPSGLAATATSTTGVNVTWTDNTGAETSYELQRSTSADFASPVTISRPADATTAADTGLDPNRTYWYRVRAVHGAGNSAWSNADDAKTQVAGPVATTSAATSVGQTTATLNGTVNPRGSATSYHFEYRKPPATAWQSRPGASTGAVWSDVPVTAQLTGLDPAATYEFRLVATNDAGMNHISNPLGGFTTATPPAPAAPSALVATALSTTSIRVNWTDNSSNESRFVVERADNAAFTGATELPATAADATSLTDGGLAPNKRYWYRVRAEHQWGRSAWSSAADATTPAAPIPPPAAPTSFVATAPSPTRVELTWSHPSTDETDFEIDRNGTTLTAPGGSESLADDTAASSTTYTYRIRARGPGGNSAWSATQTVTTPAEAPTAATGGSSDVTETGASIDGSVDPHGAATTYWFEYGTTADLDQATPKVGAGSGRGAVPVNAALSGLEPGTVYRYRVVAENSAGTARGSQRTFTTREPAATPGDQTSPPGPGPDPGPGPLPDPGTPRDLTAPRTSLAFPRQSLDKVLLSGLSFRLRSNEPGTVATRVLVAPSALGRRGQQVQLVIGRATKRLTGPGKATVRVKLSTTARRLLARRRSVRVWVETTVTDAAGNSTPVIRRAIVLRAKPARARR